MGRGGGAGGAGVRWGQRGVEAVPGCAPVWMGQQEFSATGRPSPAQSSRDQAVMTGDNVAFLKR